MDPADTDADRLSKLFWDFLRLPHKDCLRGALLDAKVMMRIDSTSLRFER